MFSVTSTIVYTRMTVLILSLATVVLSLSLYSYDTIPISALLREEATMLSTEMIKDRRLISTLVAAQASIFCPLFLLGNREMKAATEFIYQFLMPFGLALSWIFCILFEGKTAEAVRKEGLLLPYSSSSWMSTCTSALHSLKYVLVALLIAEAVMVWLAIFQLGTASTEDERSIQLPVNEPSETVPPSYNEKNYVNV